MAAARQSKAINIYETKAKKICVLEMPLPRLLGWPCSTDRRLSARFKSRWRRRRPIGDKRGGNFGHAHLPMEYKETTSGLSEKQERQYLHRPRGGAEDVKTSEHETRYCGLISDLLGGARLGLHTVTVSLWVKCTSGTCLKVHLVSRKKKGPLDEATFETN